jgi:CheY-like chemotaxis protein
MSAGMILVADDESTVRAFAASVLRRAGFQLMEAVDGADALQKVQESGRIDLLLTDIRMPRMDGIALAHSVKEMYPGVPVIYISGYPFDTEAGSADPSRRPCEVLVKPFSKIALLDAVRKCLSGPNSPLAATG